MQRYESSTPHVAFGIAAVAMTAITMGILVIMPAEMDFDRREPRMLEAARVMAPAPMGGATDSASVNVVPRREPGLATVPCTSPKPSRNQEG